MWNRDGKTLLIEKQHPGISLFEVDKGRENLFGGERGIAVYLKDRTSDA